MLYETKSCYENEGKSVEKMAIKNCKKLLISKHKNSGQFSRKNWVFGQFWSEIIDQGRYSKVVFGQFWSEKLAIWSVLK